MTLVISSSMFLVIPLTTTMINRFRLASLLSSSSIQTLSKANAILINHWTVCYPFKLGLIRKRVRLDSDPKRTDLELPFVETAVVLGRKNNAVSFTGAGLK